MKIEALGKVFYLDFEHHTKAERPCTIAILYNEHSQELSRGIASCHPTDVFNKIKGRKVALTYCLAEAPIRMVHGLQGGGLLTKDCREIRKTIWQEYLKKARV